MSFWGTGVNNDFTGLYDKTPGDMYTFVGYEEEIFHKYDEINLNYFLKLISKKTLIRMFPELDNPYEDFFDNWSIKYFRCNEYLIMRKSGYEYVFKFDLDSDIRGLDIHKVSDDRYYFWCLSTSIGKEKRDYYVNIEIIGNEIYFHLKHLTKYNSTYGDNDSFVEVSKRQIDIYLGKLNDLDVTKFDSFVKSISSVKKFSL